MMEARLLNWMIFAPSLGALACLLPMVSKTERPIDRFSGVIGHAGA